MVPGEVCPPGVDEQTEKARGPRVGRRNDRKLEGGRLKKEFLKLCQWSCGSQSTVGSGLSLLPDTSLGIAMIALARSVCPPITKPTSPRASHCTTEEQGLLPSWRYNEDVADARAPDCWDFLSNHPTSDQQQKSPAQALATDSTRVG